MKTKIDGVPSEASDGETGYLDGLWRSDKRDHGSVVIPICRPVEHLHVVRVNPIDKFADEAQVTTL